MSAIAKFIQNIFSSPSDDEKRIEKFNGLWPKFKKNCNLSVQEHHKQTWNDIWKVFWSEKKEKAEALQQYCEIYNAIIQREDAEKEQVQLHRALLKDLEQLSFVMQKSGRDFDTQIRTLQNLSLDSNSKQCDSLVEQLHAQHEQILTLEKQKMEFQMKDEVKKEEARLKAELENLSKKLNSNAPLKVVIWVRAEQKFLHMNLNEILSGLDRRLWTDANRIDIKKNSDQQVNVLLNLYDVKTNIEDSVKNDVDYVSLYQLFEGNCIVVRLHESCKQDSDLYDRRVPSGIKGVNTVLMLQYETDENKLYDKYEHFAKSPMDNLNKTKNLHYLVSKVRINNEEQRKSIEKKIQELEQN